VLHYLRVFWVLIRSDTYSRRAAVWILAAGALLFPGSVSSADLPETGVSNDGTDSTTNGFRAPPDYLSRRPPLPERLLKEKREGWYVTGFPAFGFDPEVGVTLGAQAQVYDDGPRDSPLFDYSPYRKKIAVGASYYFGGRQVAFVALDVPNIGDSPWRLTVSLNYQSDDFANYFGVGESTLGPLTYPGSTEEFTRYPDYVDAIDEDVGGTTWARYPYYQREQWAGSVNVEYNLLGGVLRPMIGFRCAHVAIQDYTGDEVDGAVEQPTHLFLDAEDGVITGFEGGWDNAIRLGVTYDTRDYEPNPTSGVLAQFMTTGSSEAWGADFNYGSLTAQVSGYVPLAHEHTRLVLALNGGFSYKVRRRSVLRVSAAGVAG
jgi:hypothetical protein